MATNSKPITAADNIADLSGSMRAASTKLTDSTITKGKLAGQAKRKVADDETGLQNSQSDISVAPDGAAEVAGA